MTSEATSLIDITNEYLNDKIDVEQFISSYQNRYEDIQVKLSGIELDSLDKVYMSCEMFEPDSNIAETDKNLIDEFELRKRVKKYSSLIQ
ncbi:colicin immunity domain-containing protein [Clostridium sp. JN-1]|uniref:colicin immunity domain-containing protein n=1 Tax=Clostridium sp. JN-1 TaxID=2483110 RepID=UPI000F0B5D84|nr:colicin immunity domain-containing protein [Clostridium sp. JN-1]